MGREIWLAGIEEGETKTGIKKNTCFSLWANTSLIKIGNTGMDSGVQVKAELFGKTNMERGLWFKNRTEEDGECLQPSRNVTGLLQMPRDLVLTPLVGSYSLNSLPLNPRSGSSSFSRVYLAKLLCIDPFIFLMECLLCPAIKWM